MLRACSDFYQSWVTKQALALSRLTCPLGTAAVPSLPAPPATAGTVPPSLGPCAAAAPVAPAASAAWPRPQHSE